MSTPWRPLVEKLYSDEIPILTAWYTLKSSLYSVGVPRGPSPSIGLKGIPIIFSYRDTFIFKIASRSWKDPFNFSIFPTSPSGVTHAQLSCTLQDFNSNRNTIVMMNDRYCYCGFSDVILRNFSKKLAHYFFAEIWLILDF